jgi:hypothetical protein
VLTLCGVLKDILLVAASMLIWGTPVSLTQFFGYSIALSGLIYYKLGADQLKQYASQGMLAWSEFGLQRPALRKLVVAGTAVIALLGLLTIFAPTYVPFQTQHLRDLIGGKSSLNA